MVYKKINDYIETIFHIFNSINMKADLNKDKRLKCITFLILGYVTNLAKEHDVNLLEIQKTDEINMQTFFDYVSFNEIELIEFEKIKVDDIDTTNKEDVERFILSHIYYLTQN